MTVLRVLIVDDEPLALRRLEILLSEIADVEICGWATGCAEALEATASCAPDVVLLDIRMRDGSGFDYLERLPAQCSPAVIFVTAFDEHAIAAFQRQVLDYVLKPIELGRLGAALDRARAVLTLRERAERTEEYREVITNLRGQLAEGGRPRYDTEIWVRKKVTGFVRLFVDDILWIDAEDDYVRINLVDSHYLLRSTLSKILERLDPDAFQRIHRSTIVRRAAVTEYRRDAFGLHACLVGGQRLRVGRVYAKQLRRQLAAMES